MSPFRWVLSKRPLSLLLCCAAQPAVLEQFLYGLSATMLCHSIGPPPSEWTTWSVKVQRR